VVQPAGKYGYAPELRVPADDPDTPQIEGASPKDPIAFYVAGFRATLFDVAAGTSMDSYPFAIGGLTNLNLSANISFTITATAGLGGKIAPAGAVVVDYGSSQTFTITPDLHYGIADVKVDNVSKGPISSYTFTNVTAHHTIAASFWLESFLITPSAGPGGTISPGTPQWVSYGGSIKFDITPNTGFIIADVKVDGVSQGPIATYTFTNVTAPHAIAATFVQIFTITPTAGAGGTIDPGTPQTVVYGGSIEFDILPDTGYLVADVGVDGVSQGPITTYTFTNVTANHTISATFILQTFVITPTAGLGGMITPGTPQTVDYGGSATFDITPNPGYLILDVKVDGASQGAITTYTFTDVTANHTIEASFKRVVYLPYVVQKGY
jgi:hypothetical protein